MNSTFTKHRLSNRSLSGYFRYVRTGVTRGGCTHSSLFTDSLRDLRSVWMSRSFVIGIESGIRPVTFIATGFSRTSGSWTGVALQGIGRCWRNRWSTCQHLFFSLLFLHHPHGQGLQNVGGVQGRKSRIKTEMTVDHWWRKWWGFWSGWGSWSRGFDWTWGCSLTTGFHRAGLNGLKRLGRGDKGVTNIV